MLKAGQKKEREQERREIQKVLLLVPLKVSQGGGGLILEAGPSLVVVDGGLMLEAELSLHSMSHYCHHWRGSGKKRWG